MNIGNLEIKLLADVSQLSSDMNSAKSTVSGAMRDMESAVGFVKNAFVALTGVGSVAAFGSMISSAIEYTGSLKDMATQTGASALALDQFRTIGATSETAIDSITGAMGKLSKNMINGSEDSKGAGVALQALGLDFNTIKAMKPEDQMLAIAGSLNQFKDGADKSAAAQALFGKEGAKLLPFLKDLGDAAGDVTSKLTDQEIALRDTQAAMADAFGDNLTTIRHETDGWKRDLADGMTPALFTASQAFLDVSRESGGLKDQIKEMSRDGTFKDWTANAITGLTYLMDVFSGLGTVVKSTGLVIGGVMASVGEKVTSVLTAINQAANGEFSAAMETMAASTRQQDVITKELTTSLDAAWSEQTLGSKLRERMTDLNNTGVSMGTVGDKTLDVKAKLHQLEASRQKEKEAIKAQEAATRANNAELKKQEDQYGKLSASLGEKLSAMNTELDTGVKLTAGQQLEIKFLEDLRTGNVKFTADQTIATMAKIEEIKKTEGLIEAMKQEKKQTDENNASMQTSIEKMFSQTESIKDNTQKLQDEATQMGLSSGALYDLKLKRVDDKIAANNQQIAVKDLIDPSGKLSQQYKDQNDALKDLKTSMDAVEWAKTTKAIGDGVSTSLVKSIKDGKLDWTGFRDFMVTTFVESKLKSTISGLVQDGLNATGPGIKTFMSGVTDSIGSLFSGAFSSITSTISSKEGGSIFDTFGGMFKGVTDGMGTLFSGAFSSLSTAIGSKGEGSIFSSFSTLFSGVTDSIGSVFSSLYNSIDSLFGGLLTTIGNSIASLFSSASAIPTGSSAITGATGSSTIGSTIANSSAGQYVGSALATIGTKIGGLTEAATGYNVATGVQVGGAMSTGMPVATELGQLGAAGTSTAPAAAGGSSLASVGAYIPGAIAAVGAAYILSSMLSGPSVTRDLIDSGTLDYSGPFGAIKIPGGRDEGDTWYQPKEGAKVGYEHDRTNTGIDEYVVTVDGHTVGGGYTLAEAMQYISNPIIPPGYATGGDFGGGLRIVGENGPELEVTGPSRIFDAQTTASMLRSGGASNDEVVQELRMLREAVERNTEYAASQAASLQGRGAPPLRVQVVS